MLNTCTTALAMEWRQPTTKVDQNFPVNSIKVMNSTKNTFMDRQAWRKIYLVPTSPAKIR